MPLPIPIPKSSSPSQSLASKEASLRSRFPTLCLVCRLFRANASLDEFQFSSCSIYFCLHSCWPPRLRLLRRLILFSLPNGGVPSLRDTNTLDFFCLREIQVPFKRAFPPVVEGMVSAPLPPPFLPQGVFFHTIAKTDNPPPVGNSSSIHFRFCLLLPEDVSSPLHSVFLPPLMRAV